MQWTDVAASLNPDGNLEVLGIGIDNIWSQVFNNRQWSLWSQTPQGCQGSWNDVAAALNGGGLSAFALGIDDNIWEAFV